MWPFKRKVRPEPVAIPRSEFRSSLYIGDSMSREPFYASSVIVNYDEGKLSTELGAVDKTCHLRFDYEVVRGEALRGNLFLDIEDRCCVIPINFVQKVVWSDGKFGGCWEGPDVWYYGHKLLPAAWGYRDREVNGSGVSGI